MVFGFDCDDDGKTVFWLGTDYEDGYKGWLLCDNVPFKVRAEDFTVVKKNDGDDILKPNNKPLSVRNYQCFDDDNLPNNVEIIDSEDESNEEDMYDFVQSEKEDEHIETDYVPSLDCTGMHCEILLKTATPQLYRENAFRTLGLPVNVTLRDIERHQQKLKMAAKLGINSHDQKHSYLPLASPPNEDSIQHAMERLRDPEKQLIDEFFWFWPTKAGSYNGEAFELLAKNRVNETIDLWQKTVESSSCCVTAHNLAVLYHTHALDIEHKSVKQPLTKEDLEACGLCWKGAYREWQKLLDNENFWSQMTARIRDINNPRLTTGIARRIRYSLPKAVFQINAHLAKRAAERNDEVTCNYHIKLVNEFGFDKEVFNAVLREEVVSIRQRVKIICNSLKTNTCKNLEHADIRIWEFLLESKSLLKTIDQLLPKDDIVRDSVHDQIAKIAMDCVFDYAETTEDWKECVKLLSQIYDMAAAIPLHTHIKDNLDKANFLAEQENESVAFKLAETEKKKSISYTTESISMKCSLAKKAAEKNPENADAVIWQLLLETKPLRQNLKELISEDVQALNSTKDEIAETANLCQIAYGNRTKDWQQCVVLLMSVYELACSEPLRSRIKERISRLNENLRQEREREDLKHVKVENHAFVVSVSGTNATIPSVCSCCLGAAETTYKVSKSWGESQDRRTRDFSFPSCRVCRHHQKELRWKRAIFVFLVTVVPIAASYFIGFISGKIGYFEFMMVGGIIFIAVFSILAGLMRTKKLSEKHVSRGPAVLLKNVGAGFSSFKFWNPSYAHAFAQANSSQVKTTKVSKRSRDLHLIRGGACFKRISWIIVFVFVGYSVVYGLLHASQWHTSSPRGKSTSRVASSPAYSYNKQQKRNVSIIDTRKQVTKNYSQPSLSQINVGRAQLKEIESELESLDLQVESLSTKINTLKTKIGKYESEAIRGANVNEYSYNQTLDEHNKLVEQYNSMLMTRNAKYTFYEKEFKRINDMINKYNLRLH